MRKNAVEFYPHPGEFTTLLQTPSDSAAAKDVIRCLGRNCRQSEIDAETHIREHDGGRGDGTGL